MILVSGQQILFLCAPPVDISEIDKVIIRGQRWKAAGKNKQMLDGWDEKEGSDRDELQGLVSSMGS